MAERNVLVCGAGLMGHGIGQVMAAAGHRVWLYEPETSRAEAGRDRIAGNLERALAKEKITAAQRDEQLGRVSVATSLADAAAQAELVVEAVFEDEGVKRALFQDIDAAAPPHAVFASNTSSISITRLAAGVGDERRKRFVGMHFFSPVPIMPLIELIRGAETDDPTEAYVRGVAAELGKQVIVSKDRPGFIVNRILMPYLGESMRAFEEGLGTAEDIDSGAKLGLNHPMGPLELADFIGLDVCLHIMEVLHDGFGAAHMAPPPILRQMVDAGHLGQKTKRGFYTYPREVKG
jgi:3-hydroxybutyryl-CoA dehydrogenase